MFQKSQYIRRGKQHRQMKEKKNLETLAPKVSLRSLSQGRRGIAPTRNCTHLLKNLLILFVCVKLNFFLTTFLSLSDSHNRKNTRPQPTNPILRKWVQFREVQYQVNPFLHFPNHMIISEQAYQPQTPHSFLLLHALMPKAQSR